MLAASWSCVPAGISWISFHPETDHGGSGPIRVSVQILQTWQSLPLSSSISVSCAWCAECDSRIHFSFQLTSLCVFLWDRKSSPHPECEGPLRSAIVQCTSLYSVLFQRASFTLRSMLLSEQVDSTAALWRFSGLDPRRLEQGRTFLSGDPWWTLSASWMKLKSLWSKRHWFTFSVLIM